MTRSSGRATFQTSFTPSAHTCGFSPASPKWSSAPPVRCPWVPSASTVTFAVTSEPGSKFPSGSPSLPRPLSPVRTPPVLAPGTSSFSAAVSGGIAAPPASACSPSHPESGAVVQVVDALVVDGAVGRDVFDPQSAAAIQTPQPGWIDNRARDDVRADTLALLQNGNGHLTEALGHLRRLLEKLPAPDRASEPCGPCTADQHADIDSLLRRVARRGDELSRVERTRKVGRSHAAMRLSLLERMLRDPRTRSVSGFPPADELGQLRNDLVQVADHSQITEIEDRRIGILVDRDDDA